MLPLLSSSHPGEDGKEVIHLPDGASLFHIYWNFFASLREIAFFRCTNNAGITLFIPSWETNL